MKPFIPWVGGKRSLLHQILPRFPKRYGKYIEVFGGAAAVLFAKPITNHEVYNDFQDNLVNLFLVIKEKPLSFLNELGIFPIISRTEFELLKEFASGDLKPYASLNNEIELAEIILEPLDYKTIKNILSTRSKLRDVHRAVNYYKLIKTSYAAGGSTFGGVPVTISSLKIKRDILSASDRIKKVIIENKDFEELIRQYDRDDSFFYCDPPYYQTERIYDADFGKDDHNRLFNVLSNIKGKFLLSYNDCEYIRELYKNYVMVPVTRLNNIGQRYNPGSNFEELLIANYDIETLNTDMTIQLQLWSDKNEE